VTSHPIAADLRDAPGWYGKLAMLGDFAARRLSPEWVRRVDAWLADVMRESQQRMGERWLQSYLTAPVLRYAWAPGVVDAQWWFGVLMPSCDSVGRYFPLVIAHPRAQPPADRIALDHLELWYERLGCVAMRTLSDGEGSVELLEAGLREVPPWPTSGRAPSLRAQSGQQLRPPHLAPLSQWLPALAAQDLVSRLTGCTVWWRANEAQGLDAVEIVQGLPDGARFAELLCGGG
jgi:type VI secretion system protein ImpM